MKKICRNCPIYNYNKHECGIVILNEGITTKVPRELDDDCFFLEWIEDENGNKFQPIEYVQHMRFWIQDSNGNPTNENGQVMIEYPVMKDSVY